jgi:hypothetical protein
MSLFSVPNPKSGHVELKGTPDIRRQRCKSLHLLHSRYPMALQTGPRSPLQNHTLAPTQHPNNHPCHFRNLPWSKRGAYNPHPARLHHRPKSRLCNKRIHFGSPTSIRRKHHPLSRHLLPYNSSRGKRCPLLAIFVCHSFGDG